MNIHIAENYYLRSDQNNFMPSIKTGVDKKGKDVFRTLSYHSTLRAALDSFTNDYIRLSDAETLTELRSVCTDIKRIVNKIHDEVMA